MLSEDNFVTKHASNVTFVTHKMFCCPLLSVVLFHKVIVISDCDFDCGEGDDDDVHGHE